MAMALREESEQEAALNGVGFIAKGAFGWEVHRPDFCLGGNIKSPASREALNAYKESLEKELALCKEALKDSLVPERVFQDEDTGDWYANGVLIEGGDFWGW
jgi:hypothetical protein